MKKRTRQPVIGIDPGKSCGIACIAESGVLGYWDCGDPVGERAEYLIASLYKVFAVESQYFGKNVKTLISLAVERGRWEQWAIERGMTTIYRVAPATWQAAILGRGSQKWDRKARKAGAIAYVKQRFGIDVLSDEADACCIAAYAQDCLLLGVEPGEQP